VAALAALLADAVINLSMIVLGWLVAGMGSIRDAVRAVIGDHPIPFLSLYACLGQAALLLAVVYEEAGNWGLLTFFIPVLLGHQVFVKNAQVKGMREVISKKTRALSTITTKIADERREERLAVAAGLHDELLPPLYKVHLMGQVLRQDLATGRLFNLEDDLPELLGATEEASQTTQALIRSLRRSAVGAAGLVATLRLLIRDMQSSSSAHFELAAEDVGGSPLMQLLAYQIVREALRNAVSHSHADNIEIRISSEGRDMRLIIEDDGEGFDPDSVDERQHFGIQLMRERVELAGGVLHVDSRVGEGTRVVVRLPAGTSAQ
jgi:signal transduction histidine kinase